MRTKSKGESTILGVSRKAHVGRDSRDPSSDTASVLGVVRPTWVNDLLMEGSYNPLVDTMFARRNGRRGMACPSVDLAEEVTATPWSR